MLNLSSQAPNLARLLVELRHCGVDKSWAPWDWDRFKAFPALPRVRFGRTVISPATWFLWPQAREDAASRAQWEAEFPRWCAGMSIPDRVTVISADRAYEIDTGSALHREMLRRDVIKEDVKLCESPLALGRSLGWIGERAAELVVPLKPARPAPPSTDRQYLVI